MSTLQVHLHPLSSYCWKVLIALYEQGTPFEARVVNFGDAEARAAFRALWPAGKIPLLVDGERVVPETSIQIEYLEHRYPGRTSLLPAEFEAQLAVRLWDRLFDQYVMTPMQRHIGQLLRPEADRDALTLSGTRQELASAYALIETRMGEHTWAAGESFTMADCAAAPSLFYAAVVQPFAPEQVRLAAYFERLVARPSVQRVIAEAQPFFQYFPLNGDLPARFRGDTGR